MKHLNGLIVIIALSLSVNDALIELFYLLIVCLSFQLCLFKKHIGFI